jgi:transposase
MSSKRKLKAYTIEEKLNVIDRTKKGTRQCEIAKELDLPESTLRGWIKNENKL